MLPLSFHCLIKHYDDDDDDDEFILVFNSSTLNEKRQFYFDFH